MRFLTTGLGVAALCSAAVASATAQESATITGRVTNVQGQPEQAVHLRIDSLGLGAMSGADGSYRIVVTGSRLGSARVVAITASKPGFVRTSRHATVARGASLTQNFQMATEVRSLEDLID